MAYKPPSYTIAGGAKYGSLPTFVYNCDSNYLGEKLEESNWWIFSKNRKCKNACGGHEEGSAGWNNCMDVCVEMESMGDEKEKNGWLKDLFSSPSAESCEEQCQGDGCLITMNCDECVNDCQDGKSKAGEFVESEGGFLAVLDKLGGMFSKAKGWGKGDGGGSGLSDNEWRLREAEEKNKRLIWGVAIFVFLLVVIGFVIFMARKKK